MDFQTRKHMPLQGSKPAALMVNRNSTKMKKQHHLSHANRSPIIVHVMSPKVIHVRPEEFMSLVQQLTGNTVSSTVHSPSHPDSNMNQTFQKMEKEKKSMDENPIDDFIGSLGHAGFSVDFQALMQFVDFV